ncbi:MAG: PAS domain S-box protein [Nitrospira sp. LK70]|nr:PAS domain S-box protein [Nitrospira sp. LK70]
MIERFGNFKIRSKLLCGFGVIGLLLVIIGGLSIVGMNRLNGNTEFIYKTNLIGVTVMGDLRAQMLRRSNFVVWHMLANDSATMAAREKSIAELDKEIEDLLAKYVPLIVTEPEKQVFEKLTAGIPEYMEVRKKVLQLSKNFSKDAAAEVQKTELAGKIGVLYDAVDWLVEENKRQAEESYRSGHDLSTNLNWGMGILNISAILIGAFTVWFVSKLISKNLLNVLDAAHKLQDGQLTHRSTVTAQDEIGELAQAFNQMAEALAQAAGKQQEMMEEMQARIDIMDTTSIVSEADLKGDILTANEKYREISKYSEKELIGSPHSITRHPDMPKETFRTMWKAIGRGEIFRGVIKNRAKDGTPYYVDAVIKPITGPNGKPRKYLGVRYEITQYELARQNMKGIVDAIDASYATIEFDLKGNVLTANNVFLQTMGYSLDEIKGKHHSQFVDSSHSGSPEYRAFWEKLGRGEREAGQYKYITKSGKEVWVQSSYNPVMDEMGRPFKVLQLADDITGQKQAQVEVEKLIVAAAAGQLSERIKTDRFEGTAKVLTQSFNQLLDSVAMPLNEAQAVLTALASNDLTKMLTGVYQGEFEQMKTSVNDALTNLATTIAAVRESVEAVATCAEEITKGNEDLSQRTSEQASALEETSASMEEMTSTVKQNADNAKQANQLAVAARDTADKGGVVTKQAVDAMAEINKSSKKIADIITVIDEIAFQTNLLALNAAVEAARAGEHGRGFAVVAAEVRNLAQRSATAAKEIKGLINESIQRVNDGSELVNQSGKTLEEIVSAVKRVGDIIAEITAASQEQASGIDQVNKAIMAMDETTQQNAALVEETTSTSQSMRSQAAELLRRMALFKIQKMSEAEKAENVAIASVREHAARSIDRAYNSWERKAAKSRSPHTNMSKNAMVVTGGNAFQGSEEFEEF